MANTGLKLFCASVIVKTLTEEHKRNIGLAGRGRKWTPEQRAKYQASIAKTVWRKRGAMSDEHKLKIRNSLLKNAVRGDKHYRWVENKTDYDRVRRSGKYRQFRLSILERDNYQCVLCGATENLQVDHVKSFADFPELRTDPSNCRTLCVKCHKETDNYGFKIYNSRKGDTA